MLITRHPASWAPLSLSRLPPGPPTPPPLPPPPPSRVPLKSVSGSSTLQIPRASPTTSTISLLPRLEPQLPLPPPLRLLPPPPGLPLRLLHLQISSNTPTSKPIHISTTSPIPMAPLLSPGHLPEKAETPAGPSKLFP